MTMQHIADGLADLGPMDGFFTMISIVYTTMALVAASESVYVVAFVCFGFAVFEASFIGEDSSDGGVT